MLSRERVERAVTFARPDRPPVDMPAIAPGIEVYRKELQLPDAQAVTDFFGADTIRIEPDYIGPEPFPDWGMKHEISPADGRRYQTPDGYPCAAMTAEEIRKYPSPPATSADWYDYAGYAAKCRPWRDRAILTSTAHSIYNWAMALLGPQSETLAMFYTEPERVHAALDRMTDFHAEFVSRLLTSNPDVPQYVFFNDDICSQRGPFFSPQMFDLFLAPRLRRIADIVHRHRRHLIQHCCGAVRELLPNFIRAGVDVIHPLQPGLPGNDVTELRREFGKTIVLFRGMDMQQQMRHDSPASITECYRRLLDHFQDGGLLFNIWAMPDIPLKNMLALRAAYMKD
jgi:uroporphyrinogen decarboxylase